MNARILAVMLVACGGSRATDAVAPSRPAPPSTPHVAVAPARPREPPREPVEALRADPDETAWIIPGAAQLRLDGPSLRANTAKPLAVTWLEDRGSDIRVGVRLDHARFAIWVRRRGLLSIVAHDIRVRARAGGGGGRLDADAQVMLHAGAAVQRVEHRDGWTKLRYDGALEVEGWAPDRALLDRGPAGHIARGHVPTGRRQMLVTPGKAIRVEPRWASRVLAVIAGGYVVDAIQHKEGPWVEVGYEDGDVLVHGYLSKTEPPERLHRPRAPDPLAPPITPNGSLPDGTCLYASDRSDPIGFVVAGIPARIAAGQAPGWSTAAIDTPWGPTTFEVRGTPDTTFEPCAKESG